jgi:hypothetical protein
MLTLLTTLVGIDRDERMGRNLFQSLLPLLLAQLAPTLANFRACDEQAEVILKSGTRSCQGGEASKTEEVLWIDGAAIIALELPPICELQLDIGVPGLGIVVEDPGRLQFHRSQIAATDRSEDARSLLVKLLLIQRSLVRNELQLFGRLNVLFVVQSE